MLAVHRYDEDVWTVADALTANECADFIARGEAIGFEPASVSLPTGAQMMSHIRNNDRVILDDAALAATLWERMKPYAPATFDGFAATGLNPRLRYYRCEPGQRFKRHKDGRVVLPSGETSRVTLMFYLNDGCEGGETAFRDYGFGSGGKKGEFVVIPTAGSALFFTHERWHEGSPVRAGVKYVLRTDVFYAGAPAGDSV